VYEPNYERYRCDQCDRLMMKSAPVVIVEEHGTVLHFCTEHCKVEHEIEQVVAFAEGE
jgi:ribosomal protein L24E